MDNTLVLVGLNHRTAGVDIRERFALAGQCSQDVWAVPCTENVRENIILSTCNRVEILALGNTKSEEEILTAWARARNAPVEELKPYVYTYQGQEAVRHLFSVAASLDSMVVGEPQILGQLKKAYHQASLAKMTGPILNRLLHKAFSVAKRVRTETAVASNAVSISYAAVELCRRIFGEMHEHKAMLIGAGEMAELAAKHLLHFGIQELYVANRTFARAQSLAAEFNALPLHFEEITETLPKVDIIITSTGSTDPIIRARNIAHVLKARKNRPMFFIDIAVPRDVDPDVNAIDNVYLYDIDDLKEIVEENRSGREDEAKKARSLIEEEVADFQRWLTGLDVQPTIVALLQHFDALAATELEHTAKHLHLDDESRKALEQMLKSLLHKIEHAPLVYLKGENSHLDQNVRINTIRNIFDLK